MRKKEITEYATAVRVALANAADRDDLLEDLEDHLAEIAAESGQPLSDRLGSPEAYAAELRAAYGAESRSRHSPLRLWHAAREKTSVLHRQLTEYHLYQVVTGFLIELRPGWWVVRGAVAIMIVCGFILHQGFWSVGPVRIVVILASICLSVWLGKLTRAQLPGARGRALIALLNVVMVTGLLLAIVQAEPWRGDAGNGSVYPMDQPADAGTDPLSNIYPYSKDGKPLTGVRLYDQDGKPLEVPYQDNGWELDQRCGSPPPIANAYPLPLRMTGEQPSEEGKPPCSTNTPSLAPRPGHSVRPTPSPTPNGTLSP